FRRDAQPILQQETHAFPGILRTTRAGECQTLNPSQVFLKAFAESEHAVTSSQPRPRLLANLSNRMEIAKAVLLFFRAPKQLCRFALVSYQGLLPFVLC